MRIKYKCDNDWQEFALLDPKWAILTAKDKRHNQWEQNEFNRTGLQEINFIFSKIHELGIEVEFDKALDFGCGTGRLTRALSKRFNSVSGTDISSNMIALARDESKNIKNINFILNNHCDLRIFQDKQFDFVISLITLQHLPNRNIVKVVIKELVRMLKAGGILCVQLPSKRAYPCLKSFLLKLRSQSYYLLLNLGVPRNICYKEFKLAPYMHMQYIGKAEIVDLLSSLGRVICVFDEPHEKTYLFQKPHHQSNADIE